MSILAIDPGPTHSAWVIWDGERILKMGRDLNTVVILGLRNGPGQLVIEQIKSYGMAVSDSIFETVFWSGRFAQEFECEKGRWHQLPRMAVKMHLCHDSKARDSNIRTAVIDRFGGKEKAIGKKASPGPLYGVHNDIWAALALAITWWETRPDRDVMREWK